MGTDLTETESPEPGGVEGSHDVRAESDGESASATKLRCHSSPEMLSASK